MVPVNRPQRHLFGRDEANSEVTAVASLLNEAWVLARSRDSRLGFSSKLVVSSDFHVAFENA